MYYQELKKTLKKFKAYFPPPLRRLGVQAWRSVELPLSAFTEHRSIVNAYRIFWPAAEVADFDQFKILGPSPDEVLVEVAFTAVSPGTEQAQLLGLPGTIEYEEESNYYPGYSGSGRVIAIGKNVTHLHIGERVAGRIPHGTPGVIPGAFLFPLPENISLEEAAFIELGIIGLQGIHKAHIKPGESVLVLGQGIVGQLASRLAHLSGGAPIIAVARSKAKETEATAQGAADRFFTVEELVSFEETEKGFDVVIEATGNPNVLLLAARLARAGGRVISLGTPRGQGNLHLGQDDCRPGINIIGAHISGLPQRDASNGLWPYRNEGRLFLDLLDQGKLSLLETITHRLAPTQAGELYEALRARDSSIVGAIFDWTNYNNHS